MSEKARKLQHRKPKILTIDIETAYYEVRTFGIRDQYLQHDQIIKDRTIMAVTAKWKGESKLHYMDTRHKKDLRDDKQLVKFIHGLLSEADVIISKNGKRFDIPIIKARCQIHGMKPYAPFKHIDTETLPRRSGFSSTKLDYLGQVWGLKFKKTKHSAFPGMELWHACLAGKKSAWKEMEKYNKLDVLCTEELFDRLAPWGDLGVDLNVFHSDAVYRCPCGSERLRRKGIRGGRFQRFQCQDCGSWHQSSGAANDLMDFRKRMSLKTPREG